MELKLQCGDVVYFVDKVKGKHIRKMNKVMFGNQTIDLQNTAKLEVSLTDAVDVAKYFDIFVEKIVSGDKEVPVTIDYLDELEAEDYFKVTDVLNQMTGQKKKD